MKRRATWINNTNCDTSLFDHVIAEACKRGDGVLPEEIADVFQLVRTPPGSAADWRLDLKPDECTCNLVARGPEAVNPCPACGGVR